MSARPERRRVRVALGSRSYAIEIGVGTLGAIGPAVARIAATPRVALVTAGPVARHHARPVERSLRDAGLRVRRFLVPDGDRAKTLAQTRQLYEALLDFGVDRGSVVVALGGGSVGDLAGFVAATLLRGLRFVQIPTTLLAMVDASIGGKVGVNLPRGKNLVGAFHQPSLVWADLATLATLPERELRAGLAEVIKAAAIRDARLFARLERDLERVLALEPRALLAVVSRACAIKAEVVARDEREAGLRMLLNFGHTLGHAVEALRGYRGILHGEAVAMGMAFAAGRSEALGLAPPGTAERVRALLTRAGLPTRLPAFPRRAYLDRLQVDKKRRDARIRFVVLREVGCAETVALRPAEVLPRSAARGS